MDQQQSALIDLLNTLLEAEKAGAKTMALLIETQPEDELLQRVKDDESWSCQGLIRSIQREGGKVGTATGDFAEKVMALPTYTERMNLLIKGQAWVVKRIDKALELAMSQETKDFLEEMKRKHVDNIHGVEESL